MNRILALALLTLGTLSFCTASAHADVHFSLNVVPNDVSDFSQGATWQMVAKSDTVGSEGIVGLASLFELGSMPPSGTVNPDIDGSLYVAEFNDPNYPRIEFLYAQFPSPGYLPGVGLLGGPSDIGADFLADSFWDNASEIAFGTIPDLTILPELILVDGNETFEAIAGTAVAADIGQTVVRIAVPEPTTIILTLLACPALLRRRRN